jgi:hypothetical protein
LRLITRSMEPPMRIRCSVLVVRWLLMLHLARRPNKGLRKRWITSKKKKWTDKPPLLELLKKE